MTAGRRTAILNSAFLILNFHIFVCLSKIIAKEAIPHHVQERLD